MPGSKKCLPGCSCGHHRPYVRTEEHRDIMRNSCKKRSANPDYIQRQQEAQRGKPHKQDPERYTVQNALHSKWMKRQFEQGTEFAQKILASRDGVQAPNKLELKMLGQLGPLGWEFVGDGQVWIAGKNPDFIHRKDHRLLEVFGNYWHQEEEVQTRIAHFAGYGWPCTVIWESEIRADLPAALAKLE